MMFALSPRYLLQVNDFINYSVNRGNNAVTSDRPEADQLKQLHVSKVSAVSMSHLTQLMGVQPPDRGEG